MKDGPKNRLREMDVHRIVDAYQQGGDIPGYARVCQYLKSLNKIRTSTCHAILLTIKLTIFRTLMPISMAAYRKRTLMRSGYWQEFTSLRQVLLSTEKKIYPLM